MKYFADFSLAVFVTLLVLAGVVLIAQKYAFATFLNIAVSLFFSLLVPVGFVLARRQVRLSRIHAAEVFRTSFESSLSSNTYFDFLARKYFDSVPASPVTAAIPGLGTKFPLIGQSDWLLLGSSIPFIFLTAFGFLTLLMPYEALANLFYGSTGNIIPKSFFSTPENNSYEIVITLGSLTFISAFLYSLRLFLKALIAFDLSAITMLRAFAHTFFAIMLAVMIWRIAPDAEPLSTVAEKVQSTIAGDNKTTARSVRQEAQDPQTLVSKTERLPKIWLVLAFAIGFVPDAAFSWLLQRTRLALNRRDARASRQTAVIPLTVIDGIDFLTAFRLEEGNIASVQNLAAANPIMLHVETSFCIFLIMDWVAQAQLCAAAGPERFMLFRKLNIRTIFDLERSVLDPDSPLGLKQIAGSILLATSATRASLLRDFGVRPLDIANRDFDKALASWVNIEVIEQLVRIMMDSLHVQRFRQLWRDIEASLAPGRAGKPVRTGPRLMPGVAVGPQPNGGGRDQHSVEIAAAGKTSPREMQTEIRGE
jgi:hypothetical protein